MSLSHAKYLHHNPTSAQVSAHYSIDSKSKTSSVSHQLKNSKCNPLNRVWGHSGYDLYWGKIPLQLGPVLPASKIQGVWILTTVTDIPSPKEINWKGGMEGISQQSQITSKLQQG